MQSQWNTSVLINIIYYRKFRLKSRYFFSCSYLLSVFKVNATSAMKKSQSAMKKDRWTSLKSKAQDYTIISTCSNWSTPSQLLDCCCHLGFSFERLVLLRLETSIGLSSGRIGDCTRLLVFILWHTYMYVLLCEVCTQIIAFVFDLFEVRKSDIVLITQFLTFLWVL